MNMNTSRLLPPLAVVATLALLLAACANQSRPATAFGFAAPAAPIQTLQPGDTLRLSFPAAPTLDTSQQIRRDGMLNLAMVGEIRAAGRTPADLQAELRRTYAQHLLSGDVTLTVVSSPFTVFVAGAVLRPGRISPERAITALEAVMEAGGFDGTRANSRAVVIVRTVENRTQHVTLNLQAALEGRQDEPFYLRAYDIVYVPERFTLF